MAGGSGGSGRIEATHKVLDGQYKAPIDQRRVFDVAQKSGRSDQRSGAATVSAVRTRLP